MRKFKPVILFVVLVMTIFLLANFARSQNTNIVISEICPTGCSSKDHQWIEIYNKGEGVVDLENWKFYEDETNHGLSLAPSSTEQDYIINPGEYALIVQNDLYFFQDNPDVTSTVFDSSWGTLNKSGEEIALRDSDGDLLEQFTYKAITNFSLERKDFNESAIDEDNWEEHPDGDSVGRENYWRINNTEDTESGGEDTENTEETEGAQGQATTSTKQVVNLKINEFLPNPTTGTEWIELYNPSTSSIDLNGFEIYDALNKIAMPTGTIEASGFFVINLSSSKLNNTGGDSVVLKDASGTVVDSTSYDDVGKGNSIARSADGLGSFVETTTITPGETNIITSLETEETSSGGGGGSSEIDTTPTYNPSQIVINEIVSDPTDGAVEFVELYNRTASSVDLSGWWLEDGSESKTVLSGTIAVRGFKLIENPKGNLNNAGDIINLFAPDGTVIDKLTYGTWDDGNVSDNAEAPEDPLSLNRKVDGQDSDYDYYDFVLSSTVTPGSSNIISVVVEGGEVVPQLLTSASIKINEIMPNPVGSDSEEEFIELKNEGSETVNLAGWYLGDATDKKYKITQGIIKSGGYIVFKRSVTGIALNNTGGDEVKLYSNSESLIDSVKYSGSASEGESYARKDDNTWAWTIESTLGKNNIIEGKSAAPIISIDVDTQVSRGELVVFDASDTTDPEGEEMIFNWDFNDGVTDEGILVEHAFGVEGVYNIILTVADSSGNESKKQVIVTVKDIQNFTNNYLEASKFSKIKINEFIPNPQGSDTTEFIELYNSSDEDVDLSGIKLDDEEGGSRAFTFPDNTIIGVGEYLVIGRQDSKLALNNNGDSVRLLFPDGTILTEVRYDDVPEGASYALGSVDDMWGWTGTVTPGEENIISAIQNINSTKIQKTSRSKMIKSTINTTLEKIRDEDIGDLVSLTGVVAVEPGVLSSQYFYIVGEGGGVQVYMYKKDFPILKVGDRIEVTGEISEAYGETRVKLSEKRDIKIIDHVGDPKPKVVDIENLQEPYEGHFVQVNGEITEIKSSYMYVDDGTEEVRVYFKRGAGINGKEFQVGDLVTVVGLLAQTKSGYQILPRMQTDIEKTGVAESFVTKTMTKDEENKQDMAEKYLTATAGGLTSILIGLFAKARGASAVGFVRRMTGVAVGGVRRRQD